MSTTVNIEVVGVKEALREINSMDKSARMKISKNFREIMQPFVEDARNLVPDEIPMSGWARNWFPRGGTEPLLPQSGARRPRYTQGMAIRYSMYAEGSKPAELEARRAAFMNYDQKLWERSIKPYVSGKRPKTVGGYTRNLSAFGASWLSPTAALFDASGQSSTPQGAQMVKVLKQRYGNTSRIMWRAWEKADDDVIGAIRQLVQDIMFRANKLIAQDKMTQQKLRHG